MIPADQCDTPEKRAAWIQLFADYKADRRWAIESFFKIRTKDQKLELLKLNEAQDRLYRIVEQQEAANQPVRVIAVKPRKVGISTGIQALFFHTATSRDFQKGFTAAHDFDATEEMFQMSDLFYNELPYQVRPMVRYFSREQIGFENPDDQQRRIKPGLRSQLKIGTAGKITLGRSKDIHLLHASELPFWPDAEATELSLLNAVPMLPSTMVFKESTPCGVGNKFHNDYLDACAGRSAFAPFFMAWWEFKAYQLALDSQSPGADMQYLTEAFIDSMDDTERKEQKAYNLTLEQLNWRRWCIDNMCGKDPNKFLQEMPSNDVDCFLVSGRPKFDPLLLRDMLLNAKDPIATGNLHEVGDRVELVRNERGFVKMWKPPLMGHRYILSADVAEGIEGGDYSTGGVLDWDENEMVAEWHGHTEPDEFGKELGMLGKIYNFALVGVEANKDGGTVNTRLRNDAYPYLFYRQDTERRTNRRISRLGWLTNVSTKPQMINSLAAAMRDGWVCPSKEVIRECMTYIYHKDGSLGAQSGCNDDRVIQCAIGQEIRQRSDIGNIFPSVNEKERLAREAGVA